MSAPEVRAYRMETSIAEKFEAAATLGLLNTRMKDYFDLWHLAKGFAFEGQAVSESIRATFDRRSKALPAAVPIGFTEAFWSDPRRQATWTAFCKKSVRAKPFPSLEEVVTFVATFIVPPALAVGRGETFAQNWQPGGPWLSQS
jgi:hypothetical protein